MKENENGGFGSEGEYQRERESMHAIGWSESCRFGWLKRTFGWDALVEKDHAWREDELLEIWRVNFSLNELL